MATNRIELAEIIAASTMKSDFKLADFSNQVAQFLLNNNLVDQLDSIIRDVSAVRFKNGILDVKLLTAFEIDSTNLSGIKNLISAYFPKVKSISIDQIIDQNLIGGIRLEFPSQLLDLSVRSKLNQLVRFTTKERINA